MNDWPVYGTITGPLVMIGFGSIGRGTLPLIERHFSFDKSRMVVIDPSDVDRALLDERNIAFEQVAITPQNFQSVLTPLLTDGDGQGFCVNLSVDTSSVDIMRLTREIGVLYIDTVVEPWPGFYFDTDADPATRTNYHLRETARAEKRRNPGGTTAVSCCGANPGMVSWFVKEALLNLNRDLAHNAPSPRSRAEWARLMRDLGVKGVHIAERDTQRATTPKP
ncbi:MAG: saccharopine dehydrogenase NADP-binding domain-containing protein, partial [Pseudomonadota bacterium]